MRGSNGPNPKWWQEGNEPDYRFSLANERTFLAWIRTALGLLVAALALLHLVPEVPWGLRVTAAVILTVVAGAASAASYWYWRERQRRMRLGLPFGPPRLLPAGAVALLGLSVLVIAMAFSSGR